MNDWLIGIAAVGAAIPAIALTRAALAGRRPSRPDRPSHADVLDEPIRLRRQDALGRVTAANAFAAELREALPGQSAVFAITGSWGSGKTSFLNMVGEALEEDPPRVVIRFNPWLFTQAEQLLTAFFQEVAAQLRVKMPNDMVTANQLLTYGDALSPLVWVPGAGAWFARAGQVMSAAGRRRERAAASTSVEARRDALVTALESLAEPIFVFIDDVDRLDRTEIREMLRLVRLVAHLPNVVHVLAFDERQVVRALDDDEATGSAYLEKIVQRANPLPNPADDRLAAMVLGALDSGLRGVTTGPFQTDRWQDVFPEIVLPLIRNVRDVKRYVSAAVAAVRAMGDDIALVDVLALEALRLFAPVAYGYIEVSPLSFAGAEEGGLGRSPSQPDPVLARFLESDERSGVLRAVCDRLFPKTQAQLGGSHHGPEWLREWRKDMRVAHPEILRYYLHREVTPALNAARAARLAAAALLRGDAELFSDLLKSVPSELLEDVIESLEDYQNDFTPVAASAGVPALVTWYGAIPERPRGLFQVEPDMKVSRVVLRLLRAAPDEDSRLSVVEAALDRASLFGRYELVSLVGHRENVGHQLVSEDRVAELEARLRAQILAAATSELAGKHVLALLYWTLKTGGDIDGEVVRQRVAEPEIARSLLVDAVTDVRSQSLGTRAVRHEARLAWEPLVDVFGGEDAVRAVVSALTPEAADDELASAVQMAERYLEGWRPDRL